MENNIYMFWTNTNPLTENRNYGIKSAKENITGCNIIFLNKKAIDKHILKEYPIHPGYQYLSENHKSDYLRSYFMNFYGGGYTDIKPYTKNNNWKECFDMMNSDKQIEVIGTPDTIEWAEPQYKNEIDVKKLLCNGWFICRAHSEFTEKWYKLVQLKMDERYDDLKKHPAKDIFGKSNNYPLRWGEMQCEIFHKLNVELYNPNKIKNCLIHGRDYSKKYR